MTTIELTTDQLAPCNFHDLQPRRRNHFDSPPKPSLAGAVKATVDAFEGSRLLPVFPTSPASVCDSKTLLALLCFCYAQGIYASQDIANRLRHDGELKRLSPGAAPDAWVLRHFRRHNREAIRSCLLAALWFLAAEKMAQGFVTKVNQAHLEAEAGRRITVAAFLDKMAQDGAQLDWETPAVARKAEKLKS